ncbi:hypothetical protein ABW19_dt0202588 [Dactylella cylindrospora]|nr:hypothetical protein ABW19_dt0202588 [Dactylella cylindrospora]
MMFAKLLILATLALGIQAVALPKAPKHPKVTDAEIQAMIDDGWTIFNGTGKPPNLEEGKLAKREAGGVYICTDINWSGTCGYKVQPLDACIQLTSPWYHTISSIGPDQLTLLTLFKDGNCAASQYVNAFCGNGGPCLPKVYWPGYGDLTQHSFSSAFYSGNYNDQIGSFWVSWTTRI